MGPVLGLLTHSTEHQHRQGTHTTNGDTTVTYNLVNGYSVITRKADKGTEFETLNPQGETISTVTLGYLDARELVLDLARKAV